MNKFKRITYVLIVVALLMSLTACGGKKSSDSKDTFTITWQNDDGSVLEVDEKVMKGALPTYDGKTPVKQAPNEYSNYVFKGFSPSVVVASKDQVYKALYELAIDTHEATWLDSDGNTLEVTSVAHGSMPSHKLPENTIEWLYTGWDKTLVAVTADVVYQAVRVKQTYTITLNSNGGSEVSAFKAEYQSNMAEPVKPKREGHHFLGWYKDANLTEAVVFPLVVTGNQKIYAAWNEQVPYLDYLNQLLNTYEFNPYAYIPAKMLPGSALVSQSSLNLTYETNTNIIDIPKGGHGEQWQMIIGNLDQATMFLNTLSAVELVSSASVVAFNNYLDSNPADQASYEFKQGIYTVNIQIKDGIINYILDYTGTVPIMGEVKVQIALFYDIESKIKEGRIQLGEANALKYKISDNHFEMAIRYGGIRRTYLEIDKNEEIVEGKIFEYLGLDGKFTLGSSGQFFIDNAYITVVGNKAGSMIGFAGTIAELYQTSSGKFLGYEVKETLSSITYNTLWFNLIDTTGLTTIKKVVAPLENQNPDLVYLNGVQTVFKTKNFGGFSLKNLSRRYDIEFRTQYYYYRDDQGNLISKALLVPMIFVQQEKLVDLVSDVKSENNLSNFGINLSQSIQNKIIFEYERKIDPFIAQKDEFTVEIILDYIGEAY